MLDRFQQDPVAVVFLSREGEVNTAIEACVNAGHRCCLSSHDHLPLLRGMHWSPAGIFYYGCASVGGVEAGIAYASSSASTKLLAPSACCLSKLRSMSSTVQECLGAAWQMRCPDVHRIVRLRTLFANRSMCHELL